jgi:hypothetical protein
LKPLMGERATVPNQLELRRVQDGLHRSVVWELLVPLATLPTPPPRGAIHWPEAGVTVSRPR